MAKFDLNELLTLRVKIADDKSLVLRQFRSTLVVCKSPDMSNVVPSAPQISQRKWMRDGALAASAKKAADPAWYDAYKKKLPRGSNAFGRLTGEYARARKLGHWPWWYTGPFDAA